MSQHPSPQSNTKPFSGSGPEHVNLEWMRLIGLSGYYVSGYKKAADELVERAQADSLLFFPVGFLYRQYIEIQLKYFLHCVRCLGIMPLQDRDLHGHDLVSLWTFARKAIETKWPAAAHDELDAVESIVMEFHRVDPTAQELRYAVTTKGRVSLENLPGAVTLQGLREAVQALYEVLHSASEALDAEIGEMQQNALDEALATE